MRCGTTWFYHVLRSHPQIYMPENIKEIWFFTDYWDKGVDWYKRFFPTEIEENSYKAIGEFSPIYIRSENAAMRARQTVPNAKLIVILRNPVDRLESLYLKDQRDADEVPDFETWLKENPLAYTSGFYASNLIKWLQFFPKEQFFITTLEEAAQNPEKIFAHLAGFLNVHSDGFNQNLMFKKVNSGASRYRFHGLYRMGLKAREWTRKHDFNRVSGLIARVGKKIIKENGQAERKSNIDREKFLQFYIEDIEELEHLMNINLSHWKMG